jgi:hypothetical protein
MYIRVSPKNCIAIYDCLKLAGLEPGEYTFSSATARVLDMLLDGMRRDKHIPERDGFEFLTMMDEFIQQNKAQLPSVHTDTAQKHIMPVSVVEVSNSTMEQRRALTRFKELMQKKDRAPDTWTAEDEAELEQVYQQMG